MELPKLQGFEISKPGKIRAHPSRYFPLGDCPKSYDLSLGTTSSYIHPEAGGRYEMVCRTGNGWPLYKKQNDSLVMYLDELQASDGIVPVWFISGKVSVAR